MRNLFNAYIAGLPARLHGYKVHLFAAGILLAGFVETVDPYLLAGLFPSQYFGLVVMGFGVVTYLIRQRTAERSKVPGFRPHTRGTEDD